MHDFLTVVTPMEIFDRFSLWKPVSQITIHVSMHISFWCSFSARVKSIIEHSFLHPMHINRWQAIQNSTSRSNGLDLILMCGSVVCCRKSAHTEKYAVITAVRGWESEKGTRREGKKLEVSYILSNISNWASSHCRKRIRTRQEDGKCLNKFEMNVKWYRFLRENIHWFTCESQAVMC